jgi:hypothetical protein
MIRELKFRWLLLVIMFVWSTDLYAQKNNDAIEVSYIYGAKVFSPDSTLQGKSWGVELAYHFNMQNSAMDYVKLLHISSIDVVGSYRNFESITVNNRATSRGSLGDAYSVLGRLEFDLVDVGPVKLLFTPAFGTAFSTTSYFSGNNYIIGSKFNLTGQAGLKIYSAITTSTGIQAGVDALHYSNGGERLPNDGINAINFSLGLVQKFGVAGPSTPTHPFSYDGDNSFEFTADVGERGIFRQKNELYRAGFYVGYSRKVNQVLSLRAGFDAGYYVTTYDTTNETTKYNTFENYGTSFSHWRLGLSIGGDVRLGRLAMFANYGYYLYYDDYYKAATPTSRVMDYRVNFYLTPGFRYYLSQAFALQIKQYINKSSADYLGLGFLVRVH